MRRVLFSAVCVAACGCAIASRSDYGVDPLQSFRPEIAATETGGECNFWRTSLGPRAANTIAYFPDRATAKMTVQITFDSTGRLTQYYETRAPVNYPSLPPATPVATRDSLFKLAREAHRSTSISVDYVTDRAYVSNFGAGRPDVTVTAKPVEVESLSRFGPVKDRLARVRKLCGV
jgi:hypothetical protein